MVSRHSDPDAPSADSSEVPGGRSAKVPMPVKIVVAGGFGVGKTTFVGSISEIDPLRTEAAMTTESLGVDVVNDQSAKTATTVAMDFGRITLGNDDLVLYLFGTPGQARFHFMWDELVKGAIGAVVLVDTSRLADSFAAIDYFESRRLPFVVSVNCFNGVVAHGIDDVRNALALPAATPLFLTDARERAATREALLTLVQHALSIART